MSNNTTITQSIEDEAIHIITSDSLSVAMWIIALTTIISNAALLFTRLYQQKETSAFALFLSALSLNHIITGTYLTILTSVDSYNDSNNNVREEEWITGSICKFIGFLGSFSVQMSVWIVLTLSITLYCQHFTPGKLNRKNPTFMFGIVIFIEVCFVTMLAALPLRSNLDSTPATEGIFCLRIFFPSYSMRIYNVFIATLLGICIFITSFFICYVNSDVRRRRTAVHVITSDVNNIKGGSSTARKLSCLTLLHVVCWVPSLIVSLSTNTGVVVSVDVCEWLLWFVLPISSVLHPILYVFLTVDNGKELIKMFTECKIGEFIKTSPQTAEISNNAPSRVTWIASELMTAGHDKEKTAIIEWSYDGETTSHGMLKLFHPTRIKEWQNEIKIMLRLSRYDQHPNISEYEWYSDCNHTTIENCPLSLWRHFQNYSRYICTGLYKHGSLRRLFINHRSSLTDANIHAIADQIASGLQYLHGMRIVHNNLTSTSVLVGGNLQTMILEVVISDFNKAMDLSNLSQEPTKYFFIQRTCCCLTVPASERLATPAGIRSYAFSFDIRSFALVLLEMLAWLEQADDSLNSIKCSVLGNKGNFYEIRQSCNPGVIRKTNRSVSQTSPRSHVSQHLTERMVIESTAPDTLSKDDDLALSPIDDMRSQISVRSTPKLIQFTETVNEANLDIVRPTAAHPLKSTDRTAITSDKPVIVNVRQAPVENQVDNTREIGHCDLPPRTFQHSLKSAFKVLNTKEKLSLSRLSLRKIGSEKVFPKSHRSADVYRVEATPEWTKQICTNEEFKETTAKRIYADVNNVISCNHETITNHDDGDKILKSNSKLQICRTTLQRTIKSNENNTFIFSSTCELHSRCESKSFTFDKTPKSTPSNTLKTSPNLTGISKKLKVDNIDSESNDKSVFQTTVQNHVKENNDQRRKPQKHRSGVTHDTCNHQKMTTMEKARVTRVPVPIPKDLSFATLGDSTSDSANDGTNSHKLDGKRPNGIMNTSRDLVERNERGSMQAVCNENVYLYDHLRYQHSKSNMLSNTDIRYHAEVRLPNSQSQKSSQPRKQKPLLNSQMSMGNRERTYLAEKMRALASSKKQKHRRLPLVPPSSFENISSSKSNTSSDFGELFDVPTQCAVDDELHEKSGVTSLTTLSTPDKEWREDKTKHSPLTYTASRRVKSPTQHEPFFDIKSTKSEVSKQENHSFVSFNIHKEMEHLSKQDLKILAEPKRYAGISPGIDSQHKVLQSKKLLKTRRQFVEDVPRCVNEEGGMDDDRSIKGWPTDIDIKSDRKINSDESTSSMIRYPVRRDDIFEQSISQLSESVEASRFQKQMSDASSDKSKEDDLTQIPNACSQVTCLSRPDKSCVMSADEEGMENLVDDTPTEDRYGHLDYYQQLRMLFPWFIKERSLLSRRDILTESLNQIFTCTESETGNLRQNLLKIVDQCWSRDPAPTADELRMMLFDSLPVTEI
ncbi:uncharacterized protein [Ptychodera flava]|uniref:uncharacterized protein n=1 Tax=Ptychodera flava TaxID=63121 RepID=UPI003969EFC9